MSDCGNLLRGCFHVHQIDRGDLPSGDRSRREVASSPRVTFCGRPFAASRPGLGCGWESICTVSVVCGPFRPTWLLVRILAGQERGPAIEASLTSPRARVASYRSGERGPNRLGH